MAEDTNTYGFSKADAEGLLPLVQQQDGEYIEGRVRGGGGGSRAKLFLTPGGGIAARSGTTVSSATCTEYKIVGTTLTTNTNTVSVYNIWPIAIPASYYIFGVQEQITKFWIALQPGIVNLRLSGNDLQYTLDGTTWTTWTTATTCP